MFLPLFLMVILSSCVKNNPTPVFLEINPWKLEKNPVMNGIEGDLFHGIRHVAVYVDDDILGYFELPCKIPVLKFGQAKITLIPVIMDGGRMEVKNIYPFLEEYIKETNLVEGETYEINPVTRYKEETVFEYVEDFESASMKIKNDSTALAKIQQILHDESGKSGYKGVVNLTKTDSTWLGMSFNHIVLPKGGKPVYMEIDYRTDVNVSTGMIAYDLENTATINPNVRLNAQLEDKQWKKIYIDLTEIASYIPNSVYFEYYMSAVLATDADNATIELDNIKIIHF